MKYLKLKFLLIFAALAMAIPPAWAGTVYQKVTDDNPITDGSKCILVYEAGIGSYAMGALDSSNGHGSAIGVEVENDEVDITNAEGVTEFTFVGTSTNFHLMISENTYLAYQAKGKFSAIVTSSPSTYGKECWKTGSANGGKYVINNYETDYSIRFNTNSSTNLFFGPYTSSSGGCVVAMLYVKKEGGDEPPVNTPWLTFTPSEKTIGEAGGTLTVNGDNLGSDPGVWRIDDGYSDQFDFVLQGVPSGQTWFPRTGETNKVTDGEVVVTYNGRELTATGKFGVNSNNTGDGAFSVVTYQPDLYIYCDLIDGQSWRYYPDEPQMEYADGVYTKTVNITNAGSCILFARAPGLTYGWNDDRRFFGAKWNEDWVYGVDNSKYLALYGSGYNNENQYYPIKFNQPGTYTITIDPEAKEFTVTSTNVVNIAEAQEFDGKFNFTGDVVVTYKNGDYMWIRDVVNRDGEVNSGLIKGSVEGTFANGDVLNPGWKATKNVETTGVIDFINPEGLSFKEKNTDAASPYELSEFTDADLNKYVSISGVTVTNVNGWQYTVTIDGTNTFVIYDQFHLYPDQNKLGNDKTYNVTGVVSKYGYSTNPSQLWLISAEEVKELKVTLTSDTKTAEIGETIPVTVTVENAEGDYTVTYKFGENGTENTLTGNVIDVTSATAGQVELIVNVTNGDNHATATETYTFTEPVQPGANVFKKVTSATLEPGKKYIFVSETTGNSYSMGAETHNSSNSYYILPVEVSVLDANHVEINENVDVFTLGEITDPTTQEKSYIFNKKDGKYLSPTASGNTNLLFAESTDNAGWQTRADDNGIFVLSDIGDPSSDKARTILYRELTSGNRFAHYQKTNATNSGYYWAYLYVQTAEESEPLAVTLPEAPEVNYKVGQVVKVKATVDNGSETTQLTYKVGDETLTVDNEGNITLPNKKSGEVVLTVTAVDGEKTANDTKTYVFDKADALTITLTPATGTYYVGDEKNVTVTVEDAIDANPTITYKFGEEGEVKNYPEGGIVLPTTEPATINLIVMVDDNGYEHDGETTATGTYAIDYKALTVDLTPPSATFAVGAEDTKVKVEIANVVGELVEDYKATYTVNEEEKTVTLTRNNEGYVTLPNDKAVTYTLKAEIMDDRGNIVEKEGTYTFTAAPAIGITLTATPTQDSYTVGDGPTVTVGVTGTFGNDVLITYSIDRADQEYNPETGIIIDRETAGDVTLTVNVVDGYDHEGAVNGITSKTATYNFTAAPAIEITLTPNGGTYDINDNVNVKVDVDKTIGNDYLVVYQINDGEEQEYTEAGITIPSDKAETVTLTVTVEDGYEHEGDATVTAEYIFNPAVALAAPTFSPAAGTYTEPKQVAIACATPGVTITYAIDGVDKGEYNGPFTISDGEHTVTATASKGSKVVYNDSQASATYVINAVPAAGIEDGYYTLQNKAEEVAGKYANVAGRRTLNFVANADNQAGTVFRIKTDPDTIGQVETLRSQAVDLQGYANRAMAYVPKVIEVVLNKLATSSLGDPETPGDGILGENGLDLILKKFYEKFDYNLYIEGTAESGYRIYGKTPSMQHVVDFYHENTAQVEAKLPMLEGYINQVLDKIRNRIPAPYNANVVVPFTLKAVRDRIAEKNGIALIDPDVDEMGFYRQVLNNKEYVWDFAYQTAMMYVDVIKETETYKNLPDEYKLYVTKMEKVRPDTKYYIIERGSELDYISENNVEIINNDPRTLWTLEERKTFKLNSAGELFGCPLATTGVGGYFTTNYTDFAYTLPDNVDVTAYKVTGVNEDGEAVLEALTGTIPAQTPVLLVAKEDGAYEVTLTTDAGTAVGTNLLQGPDYLITEYQITTPIVVQLFGFAQGILGDNLYNTYVAPYEYLQLRYSGTVNNKYFWNVNSDLDKLQNDCVVRSLAVKDGELAFSDHWTTENNKAFMVSEDYDVITLPGTLRGDVNHDGIVHISDVPALIDRLLEADFRACPYCSDVNEDNVVNIRDVTALIDILLGVDGSTTGTEEGGGE